MNKSLLNSNEVRKYVKQKCYFTLKGSCSGEGPLYQIPLDDSDRLAKWLSVIDPADLINLQNDWNLIRFCIKHFEEKYRALGKIENGHLICGKFLTQNAIPTLNLGQKQSEITSSQVEDSSRQKQDESISLQVEEDSSIITLDDNEDEIDNKSTIEMLEEFVDDDNLSVEMLEDIEDTDDNSSVQMRCDTSNDDTIKEEEEMDVSASNQNDNTIKEEEEEEMDVGSSNRIDSPVLQREEILFVPVENNSRTMLKKVNQSDNSSHSDQNNLDSENHEEEVLLIKLEDETSCQNEDTDKISPPVAGCQNEDTDKISPPVQVPNKSSLPAQLVNKSGTPIKELNKPSLTVQQIKKNINILRKNQENKNNIAAQELNKIDLTTQEVISLPAQQVNTITVSGQINKIGGPGYQVTQILVPLEQFKKLYPSMKHVTNTPKKDGTKIKFTVKPINKIEVPSQERSKVNLPVHQVTTGPSSRQINEINQSVAIVQQAHKTTPGTPPIQQTNEIHLPVSQVNKTSIETFPMQQVDKSSSQITHVYEIVLPTQQRNEINLPVSQVCKTGLPLQQVNEVISSVQSSPVQQVNKLTSSVQQVTEISSSVKQVNEINLSGPRTYKKSILPQQTNKTNSAVPSIPIQQAISSPVQQVYEVVSPTQQGDEINLPVSQVFKTGLPLQQVNKVISSVQSFPVQQVNRFISPAQQVQENSSPVQQANGINVPIPPINKTNFLLQQENKTNSSVTSTQCMHANPMQQVNILNYHSVSQVNTIGMPVQQSNKNHVGPLLQMQQINKCSIPMQQSHDMSSPMQQCLTNLQNVAKINSFNSREIEALNKEIRLLKKSLSKIQRQCKNQKQLLKEARKLSYLKATKNLPELPATFLNLQMKPIKVARGRRFTFEEKFMALTMYMQKPNTYKYLKSIFCLPSIHTLQQSLYPINPGVSSNIINNLQHRVKDFSPEKRLCVLLFDEIVLSPNVFYNNIKGEISGFADNGTKTQAIADHAVVFVLKGIKSNYKQPIYYSFNNGTINIDTLKPLLIELVRQISSAGIKIVAIVCDHTPTNVETINSFKEDTRANYLAAGTEYETNAIEIDSFKVFTIYDTPCLLVDLRNNLLMKNLRFLQDDVIKLAKWEHLQLLLVEDIKEDDTKFLKKLTEAHVIREKIPMFSVKHAVQVFSQQVSAAMRFLSKYMVLPAACTETADLLLIFDKLLDSFYGDLTALPEKDCKKYKMCVKNSSPHFKLWHEMKPILRSMYFIHEEIVDGGNQMTRFVKEPCLDNFRQNIDTFIEMWEYLQREHDVKFIMTRNFTLDPIRTFFSKVRFHGYDDVKPTCQHLSVCFRKFILETCHTPHFLVEKSDDKDTEEEESSITGTVKFDETSLLEFLSEIEEVDETIHAEARKQVADAVLKKCKDTIFKNCTVCFNDFITISNNDVNMSATNFDILIHFMYNTIISFLQNMPETRFLKHKIIFCLEKVCDFSIFTCSNHKNSLIPCIKRTTVEIVAQNWCKYVDDILNGKLATYVIDDAVKAQAHVFSENRVKRKRYRNNKKEKI